ncbi:arsenic transporter [Pyxidicoccus parkwayensis]|uniref:arsenite-transporting ATPase n=1 Tax=Pyxidicoccus parkwayensis TaxID=2813578 RepID=A0ABX7NW44_9BACT|nr:ArsA-related P-loop ATPase [Pyxidicoccus parkwaysis]QSQ21619.1 arsenic transporter [Pyxidicoccus parkwaysis]
MLEALWDRRALLVSGKGGVGKTTLAASLAVAAARSGRPVLLAEMAPDESGPSPLGALVGAGDTGLRVTQVRPGLRFVRLAASEGHRHFLQDTLHVRWLSDAALRSRALRRFLEAGPALREMGLLYQMLALVRRTRADGRFEYPLSIIDLPSTGHALALATLPRTALALMPGGQIGRSVREGLEFLQDPVRTAVLLTSLPEPLPVSEALMLASELERLGLPLAAAVLNRMPEDPFTPESHAALRRLLATHGPHQGSRALARLERASAAKARLAEGLRVPLLTLPELPVTGIELVERLADTFALSQAGDTAREATP